MNILVTGGAGYIGSHACKALAEAGYTPVTLDNLDYGHRWSVKWGPLVEGDLADNGLLQRTFSEYQIDAVMHFAAYAYVGESMTEPGKYFRNNVINTIRLLDAMVECDVNSIVFSSTCASYGLPVSVPMDEQHPQRPVNPYGESKLFIERALKWYSMAHGIRVAALRYFNAAGADPDCEIGEDHHPETHLIPLVIEAALGRRSHVDIYGSDYPTPDGSAIRDYIHVTDLATAHVMALGKLQAGSENMFLNLGTSQGYSVREVISKVEQISGKKVDAHMAPRRAGDPAELVAATGLAAETLGWKPEHSSLETIIKTALNWHKMHRRLIPVCANAKAATRPHRKRMPLICNKQKQ
jgi:UDP-glucose-4-epimerase GalE